MGNWCRIEEPSGGLPHPGHLKLRFGTGDGEAFRDRLDHLKQILRFPDRRWDPDQRCWWIASSQRAVLLHWVDDWFEADAVSWGDADDSGDSGAGDDQNAGDEERTPRPPPRAAARAARLSAAYATLHLLPTAPPPVVKAAYRALAALHHPDRGGDTASMQRINVAFDLLRPMAAEPAEGRRR